MGDNKLKWMVLLIGAFAFSSSALARQGRGADDPPGHISGGHGADDPSGHDSGGHGTDDPSGHDSGGHGTDDPSGHDSGGHGTDDPSSHDSGGHGTDDPSGHVSGGHGTDDPSGHDGGGQGTGDHGVFSSGRHTVELTDDSTGADSQGTVQHLVKGNKTVLNVGLSIAYPNKQFGLLTRDDAKVATILAKLKANTAEEKICELDFDRIRQGKAEYRLSLKQRANSLKEKSGSCDAVSSLPNIGPGDRVVIVLENEDGTESALASGSF